MENPKITVKEIEEFLSNRYERFASKKDAVTGVDRYIFFDVSGFFRTACIYYHVKGERVYILDGVPFEQALEYWNNQ